MKTMLTGLALLAALIPAAASAAPPTAVEAEAKFKQVDTNNDGALSLEEWKAAGRRERGFSMVDADHDGKVTPAELRAIAAKRGG